MAEQMSLAASLPPSFDPFGDAFLGDPYPHHKTLREAGPLVFLILSEAVFAFLPFLSFLF